MGATSEVRTKDQEEIKEFEVMDPVTTIPVLQRMTGSVAQSMRDRGFILREIPS